MSGDNIRGVDSLVEEYLIHRGFTQTFRALQREKSHDRTHGFHAIKIVEQVYQYLETSQMSDFIDLWDFLTKRFFMHLDQETLLLLDNMKTDLIKFYLVNLSNHGKKKEMSVFFETYSHEIIADSGNSTLQLRSWYALPYMSEPDKDPEFGPYFSKRWADMLRITLHNFLSTILFNTPSPKLLLLEKWFRSDAQEDTRRHLTQSRHLLTEHLHKENTYHDRIFTLQATIRDLVTHIHALQSKDSPSSSPLPLPPPPSSAVTPTTTATTTTSRSSSRSRSSDVSNLDDSGRHVLTDREDMSLTAAERIAAQGRAVCDLATSCVQHRHASSAHHHHSSSSEHSSKHTLPATDTSAQSKTQARLNGVLEVELLAKIQQWLEASTVCD